MAPRTRKIEIPFNAGQHEGIDRELLPLGLFVQLANCRYRKDGRLGSRAGYVTVPLDVDAADGTLSVFDLHNLGNRVFARANGFGDGYPTNLYELVEHSSATWREVAGFTTVPTLCPFSDVKHLPASGQPVGGATRAQLAACNGYIATAISPSGALFNSVYVTIQRENGSQVASFQLSTGFRNVRCCTVATGVGSNRAFVFVAEGGTSQVEAFVYDPNTNTNSAPTLLGALHSADGTIRCYDVAEVVGTSQFVFAVATSTTNQVRIFRYNLAGVQQGGTLTVAATNATSVAVEADNAASNVSILIRTSAPAVNLRTITFAGAVTGPTVLFGASTPLVTAADQVRIVRLTTNSRTGAAGAARVACFCNVSGVAANRIGDIAYDVRGLAAHAQLFVGSFQDVLLEGKVIAPPQVAAPGTQNCVVFSGSIGPSLTRAAARTQVLTQADLIIQELSVCVKEFITLNGEGDVSYDASTGRAWWAGLCQSNADEFLPTPTFTGALVNSTARCTSAEIAGSLVLGGGWPQVLDGLGQRELGFSSKPGIRATAAQAAAGGLTNNGFYDYVATWSRVNAQGEQERSAPSDPATLGMGATGNQGNVTLSTPRTMTVTFGFGQAQAGFTLELWRTVWDNTNAVKLTGFRKVLAFTPNTISGTTMGATITLNDTMSDANAAAQELLYTDAGSGALSGPLPRVSAPCSEFVSAVGARLQLAGLPDRQRYCESLSKQPGRPICFPPNALKGVGYYNEAQAAIIGSQSTDSGRLLFTDRDILVAAGPGANEDGQGQLPEALGIGSDLPLLPVNAKGMLRTKDGIWYQSDSDKLCMMPIGGGLPQWTGQEMRDTVTTFPRIDAAAQVLSDDTIVFAANNSGQTLGRLLVRDQRNNAWYQDQLPGGTPRVRALAQQNGRLVIATTGGVLRQTPGVYADATSTVVSYTWVTGRITQDMLGGWQEIVSILIKGEWRADCQVSMLYATDLIGQTLIKTYTLTGLVVGGGIQLLFTPRVRKCTKMSLLGVVAPTVASDAFLIHGIELEVIPKAGPVRLPRARRG